MKASELMENVGDYILWFTTRRGWSLVDLNGQTIHEFGQQKPSYETVVSEINAYERVMA